MLVLMSAKAPTNQHKFRQRSSLGLAAAGGVTGSLVLLSLVRNWAADPQPLAAGWVLFGLAVVWALFVRPCVLLDAGGVTLRNILRDVHIPWIRLTDVQCRWSLRVFAGDQGYTSWALTAAVERPHTAGGMFSILPGRIDTLARADTEQSPPAAKVTGTMVAQKIGAAMQEQEDAVERGLLAGPPDGSRPSEAMVRITWVPLVVVVVLLPVIVVLGLSLS